jgi:hypothetical protein
MRSSTSRHNRGRFIPRLEALEDRTLLNATLSTVAGVGQITTTGAVNHVLITDDGTTIKVFSDNGFLGTFHEGTPLSVKTNKAGSTNFIGYAIQGSANQDLNATTINGSLNVDFGTGNGQLVTAVLGTLPTSLVDLVPVVNNPANISNLGEGSNLQIAAKGTSGNILDVLFCDSIGFSANLSDVATGGTGANLFLAGLTGQEDPGATVTLKFTGVDGNNTAVIQDDQTIGVGASTNIDLQSNGDIDDRGTQIVNYAGVLQGSLDVTANAGAGTNVQTLDFVLQKGSDLGILNAAATTGPGAAKVSETVHKDAADNPFVDATATAFGPGVKQGSFTIGDSPTSVKVDNTGFSPVTTVE